MNTFYLEILSPERVFYRGECVSIVMPTGDGMLGIMANHAPLCASIEDGEVVFTKPDGETVICAVMRGIADMTDNHLHLLCESALAPDEIDAEAERRLADEAEKEMRNKQIEHDFAIWQMTFKNAMNRLRVKGKSGIN